MPKLAAVAEITYKSRSFRLEVQGDALSVYRAKIWEQERQVAPAEGGELENLEEAKSFAEISLRNFLSWPSDLPSINWRQPAQISPVE